MSRTGETPAPGPPPEPDVDPLRRALAPLTRPAKRVCWWLAVERDARLARFRSADLAVFHDFAPPPAGGAHQTLRALLGEMGRRGVRIEYHRISATTRACLFNSFNFDFERLERLAGRARAECRMVHRVDGPIGVYRGWDDGTDARIAEINRKLAERSIVLSRYTLEKHRELGIELVEPRVIHNPTDPRIFHPRGRLGFSRDRKIRLICSSWSDNPKKGIPTYRWLEERLDWDRFEFTFVGNSRQPFERIRRLPPLPSDELAELLRRHDIFITATEHDAYSNALVEALSCGLPALYLDSGGSREAVKEAGLAFRERDEIPKLLDHLVDEYEQRQAAISLPSLAELTDQYLETLGLAEFVGVRVARDG